MDCSLGEGGDVLQDNPKYKDQTGSGAINIAKSFWLTLPLSSWLAQWIEEGVPLHWEDLKVKAPACFIKNHKGAMEHEHFVDQSVGELVAAGAVCKVAVRPKCVHPLNVVPKKNGKLRLILDLRHVNQFLHQFKFKFESLSDAAMLMQKGDLLCSADLTNGYWQLRMRADTFQYLGFEWKGDFYVFKVLPFGLSTAPYVFAQTMRAFSASLRNKGFRLLNYLDDFLFILGPDLLHAEAQMRQLLACFQQAGLRVNNGKSVLHPCTALECLGYEVDTVAGMFKVTESRWQTFHHQLSKVCSWQGPLPAKELARVTGHLASFKLVLGDLSRFRCRELYRVLEPIATKRAWHLHVQLDAEAFNELMFWKQAPRDLFTTGLWPGPSATGVEVFSDASGTGWGGHTGDLKAKGSFSKEMCGDSSGRRELFAIFFTLQSFVHVLKGTRVCIKTDSQNAMFVLKGGSRKPHMHRPAVAIAELCAAHDIKFSVVWIPRGENQLADDLSKQTEFMSDWQLNPRLCAILQKRWRKVDIDRFAASHNAQCARFNALFYCPGVEAVDAFAQDWSQDFNWCNPPFSLIGRVLCKIMQDQAHGILIIPRWPSAWWWPMLVDGHGNFNSIVKDWVELPNAKDMFMPGIHMSTFDTGCPRWRVFALLF